jgi:hypothetical protein
LRGAHLIDETLYTICIMTIIATTIATPLMLGVGFSHFTLDDEDSALA